MQRFSIWLAVVSICVLSSSHLHAAAIQLTSPDQLNRADTTAYFPGQPDSYLPSPLKVMAGPGIVQYVLSDKSASFYRYVSNGQTNDFPAGTGLIDTNGAYGPYIRIHFDSITSEFGFYVQSEGVDIATFTLDAFDGTTKLLNFSVGPVDNTSTRGQSAFIGARATGGDLFTGLEISSVSSQPEYSNYLILGPPTFAAAAAPVPEPSSFVPLSLLALAFAVRKVRTMRTSV